MADVWNGSTSNAALPEISGMDVTFDVITGDPQAMASITGIPNPSESEGKRNALHKLYIDGRSSSDTYPGVMNLRLSNGCLSEDNLLAI